MVTGKALEGCEVQHVSQLEVHSSAWEQHTPDVLWGLAGFFTSLHFKAWAPHVHFSNVHTLQVSRPSESFDSVLHSAALREGSLWLSKVRLKVVRFCNNS